MATTSTSTTTKRTVLITGATSGLGYDTAKYLLAQGHTVIVASRNPQKVQESCDSLAKLTSPTSPSTVPVIGMTINLSSLESVKQFISTLKEKYSHLEIDSVVLNAGLVNDKLELSADGFEMTFATNHLGHFYLVRELEDLLVKVAKKKGILARVVVVSSGTHDPANNTFNPHPFFDPKAWANPPNPSTFSPMNAYPNSKLANALTANDLSHIYKSKNLPITVATYDPGFIPTTSLLRLNPILKTVAGGIITGLLYFSAWAYGSPCQVGDAVKSPMFLARLSVDEELVGVSGEYYSVEKKEKCSVDASDLEKQKELRVFTEGLLKEKGYLV
ncbi:hypothetical protein HDU76_013431 [Blyttiomyces sp. JEL0837]|nr:hypothetical protein HDU76_013431 [Blyttiomyces sp. JEL0837]